MMLNFFKKLGWTHPHDPVLQNRLNDPISDSQEKIMGIIKNELFNKKTIESETIVLYYSGHGEESNGALLLFGKDNTKKSVCF